MIAKGCTTSRLLAYVPGDTSPKESIFGTTSRLLMLIEYCIGKSFSFSHLALKRRIIYSHLKNI